MAPRLQWSISLVSDEFIVPRLEDHLIDELFYQEDEIGEMRHTAFMVECGLEEDPPDGPDVPPVPWGDMLLKQQQELQEKLKEQTATEDVNVCYVDLNDDDSDSDDGTRPLREKRELPNRSRSTDDIDTLAIELTSTQRIIQKRPPKRSNSTPAEMFVVKGQPSQSPYAQFSPSSPGRVPTDEGRRENRRPPRRVPAKVSPEASPKRKAPVRGGGLTKTRSGTTHEMASAAARARKKLNQEKNSKNDGPKYRKLTKTSSGTCHEMANAAAKARKKLDAEKAKKAESAVPGSSPSVAARRKSIQANENKEKKGRPAPLVRGLVATKSGTKHKKTKKAKEESKDSDDEGSPKIVYKNGKRTADRRRSSVSKDSRLKSRSSVGSSVSDSGSEKKKEKIVYRNGKKESIKTYNSLSDSSFDDDFLTEIIQDSDDDSVGRSDISISTCESESDDLLFVPKSIEQPLELPTRQRSLSGKSLSSDYLSDDNEPKYYDLSKKKKKKKEGGIDDSSAHSSKSLKKKKKKKDKGDGLNDDSFHSTKSLKKRKKKKDKEALDNDTKDQSPSSFASPRQMSTKQSEISYPSPSSIRSPNRFSVKKSPRMEPVKDDSSSPSIIKIGSPAIYGSPGAMRNRKKLFIPKGSSPFEPQSPSPSAPSIIEIAKQREGQTSRPNDFLCTDPLAAIKKKKERERTSLSSPRPGDWLGSGSKPKRSWRVKSKPAEN